MSIEVLASIILGVIIVSSIFIHMNNEKYTIKSCKVVDSNDKYFTIKALIRDDRVFRRKNTVNTKFLCYWQNGQLIVKYYGDNRLLEGYNIEVFESCILNYKDGREIYDLN